MLTNRPPFTTFVWRHAALAAAGAVLIVTAAMDELARLLMSVHMVQPLLLSIVAPVLLVAARPRVTLGRLIPLRARRALRNAVHVSGFGTAAHLASNPLAA